MKKLVKSLFAIALCALCACGPTKQDAANFNNALMAEQKAVLEKYDAFKESFDTYLPEKMDNSKAELIAQLKKSQQIVENTDAIAGGENLKQATADYIATCLDVATQEGVELVRIYKVPENEFTEQLRDEFDGIMRNAETKVLEAHKKLNDAQEDFANKNGLKLQKNLQ